MKRSTIIILAIVCILLFVAPFFVYTGGEEQGQYGGADDAAGDAIGEIYNNTTGKEYTPWFNSLWEPPSGEIESLLFALQAAIGAIIIGYFFGYWRGQKDE